MVIDMTVGKTLACFAHLFELDSSYWRGLLDSPTVDYIQILLQTMMIMMMKAKVNSLDADLFEYKSNDELLIAVPKAPAVKVHAKSFTIYTYSSHPHTHSVTRIHLNRFNLDIWGVICPIQSSTRLKRRGGNLLWLFMEKCLFIHNRMKSQIKY